ncbi:hypothetical protein BOX15_Mlig028574g2 [Macrostomum lignano]|uniref:SCP domain-containing protein n=1 Tax=Macrostomum lignano TaxID=282301 RepID=A0A267GM39_9PLAT|nr:hypothetical protein BOX15_Mlig028574g2 [Macrostomum lignano]
MNQSSKPKQPANGSTGVKAVTKTNNSGSKPATSNSTAADKNNNNNKPAAAQNASNEAASGQVKLVTQPQPPPAVQLRPFDQLMLDSHNYYRAHHSAPPLKYCSIMAKRAQYWADTLASKNSMYHERQTWDGENLAWKWNSGHCNFPATDFVNMWYYEAQHYRFPGTELGKINNGGNYITGHFSQVVWKNSQRVGFGRAVSKTGRVYVVARYRPPGNFVGWFKANVLPPKDGKLAVRFRRQ